MPHIVETQYEYGIKSYIYNDILDTGMDHLDYVGFIWHLVLDSDLDKSKVDKFIILERRNKLEQFVSLKIATQTGKFGYVETTAKIEVDINEFFFFLNKNKSLYSDFRNSTQNYKNVYYEDICDNFGDTIKDINDYLGTRQIALLAGDLLKQETRPMKDVIINYEDVKEYDRLW
jgi:LPS sulfotransferase NodH